MKIVLLGYMGSGKTTIGEKLASETNLPFIDLDHYIENSEGISVPMIFETKGEIYFRKKENQYLKEILSKKSGVILSTGGGTPCYGNNMDVILNATENTFYLKVSISNLVERLSKEKEQRPIIKNIPDGDLPEFIGKHLFERSFFYNQAHHVIDCDSKSLDTLVKEIKAV